MVLCPATASVCPGQEINTASFADCFTVRAAPGLNVCLFYSMTPLKYYPEVRENKCETNKLAVWLLQQCLRF